MRVETFELNNLGGHVVFMIEVYIGFPKLGIPFSGPNNKDYNILGSMLGSPCYFVKLPYCTGFYAYLGSRPVSF